jgi:hypothetical protein
MGNKQFSGWTGIFCENRSRRVHGGFRYVGPVAAIAPITLCNHAFPDLHFRVFRVFRGFSSCNENHLRVGQFLSHPIIYNQSKKTCAPQPSANPSIRARRPANSSRVPILHSARLAHFELF